MTLDRPVWMCERPDGSGQLFIVEQRGRVLIVPRGQPAERVEKAGKREVAERIWDAFLRERRRQASERSASTVHLSDAHPNERREG